MISDMDRGVTQQIIYRPVPGYQDLYAGTDASIVLAGKGVLPQKLYRNTRYYSVRISREVGIRVVHRLVAAAFFGPKKSGMHVRHGINGCLDDTPGNLCYGSASDNQRDAVEHGTNWNSQKVKCPQGHEYTPENTCRGKDGGRLCRTCRDDRQRKRCVGVGRGRRLTADQKSLIEQLLSQTPPLINERIAEIAGIMPSTVSTYRKRKALRDKELGES